MFLCSDIYHLLLFVATMTSLAYVYESRAILREINGTRVWRIQVRVHAPRKRSVCKSGPSPVEVNKGLCPPSLCVWNEQDNRHKPMGGQNSPFFHGDIILDESNAFLRYGGEPPAKIRSRGRNKEGARRRSKRDNSQFKRRSKRATSVNSRLWPKRKVIYQFDDNFNEYTQTLVLEAMKHIESQTCIRFKKKREKDRDYLLYVSEPGCWSYIGRVGGTQRISLGEGCEFFGTAVHETCHALGFWHEQSRNDRDEYVKVMEENIIKEFMSDFTKVPDTVAPNYGYAYDYGSVMHYRNSTFTKNAKLTIEVTGPGQSLGLLIGQRDGLSNIDIAQLNSIYKCNKRDDLKRSVCPSGWARHKRRCYKFVMDPKQQFAGAARHCSSLKAELARVEGKRENKFILKKLKKNKEYRHEIWRTGGRKNGDTFKWYNTAQDKYTNMKYKNWALGQPGSHSSHVYVWNETANTFQWEAVWLGSLSQKPLYEFAFICEKSGKRQCVELKHSNGRDYRGELDHTKSGITCQSWTSQWPHSHTVNLKYGIGDHNFCRNPPDMLRSRPWCYTTLLAAEWEYCDVSACNDETVDEVIIEKENKKKDKTRVTVTEKPYIGKDGYKNRTIYRDSNNTVDEGTLEKESEESDETDNRKDGYENGIIDRDRNNGDRTYVTYPYGEKRPDIYPPYYRHNRRKYGKRGRGRNRPFPRIPRPRRRLRNRLNRRRAQKRLLQILHENS